MRQFIWWQAQDLAAHPPPLPPCPNHIVDHLPYRNQESPFLQFEQRGTLLRSS